MLSLQQIARALGGEVSGGHVRAPGPGHSAKDRSLSIKLDPNAPDGLLVNTFAPQDDPVACKDYVREKCGLPAFHPNGNGSRSRRRGHDIAALMAAAIAGQRQEVPQGQLVSVFDYADADGTLLYQCLKYADPKSFKQRRPDGNGGWIWKLDERRVLYRLADLLKHPYGSPVFVTEGEKDADRVAGLNLLATTVASGKWTDECVQALAGRHCIVLVDNDEAGRKRAIEAAQRLHGAAETVRIVLLPDLPPGGDVSDWLDADTRRADKLVDMCLDIPPWTPTQEAPEVDAKANDKADETARDDELPWIDMSSWDDQPVPEREWAVADRIPLRQPTLFSGEGAAGKTIIALQLCVAQVLGRDWLKTLPEPGPAIYLGAEDDTGELHRRLAAIAAHYGVRFADLITGGLRLLSYAGHDAVLAAPNRSGLIVPTPLFQRLQKAAIHVQPKLIVLDTAADVFAGNENDRGQVRQFIGLLRRLGIDGNCGVLLSAHPSLTGINTGTGLSGSIGWHNSVRARMYLKPATTDAGEEPDPDLKELSFKKNNYGPIAQRMLLRWSNGVFIPEPGASSLEKAAADAKAEHLFLELLERFNGQCRDVNDRRGHAYAPALFAQEPEAKTARFKKDALADAMRRLFAAQRIRVEAHGRPSRPSYRIVRA